MDILLSESAAFVLARLQSAGFEAYAVGGCVRDSLMGKKPYDWDIATSAFPEQVVTLFQNTAASVIPTGIKHGTVTVIVERNPVEVTTFRTEQKYSDHRHPDAVSFTSSLQEDLERRDFTTLFTENKISTPVSSVVSAARRPVLEKIHCES